MKLSKVEWKNFASYGNKMQTIEFEEKPNLYLLVGNNAAGKCLSPDTKIIVKGHSEVIEKIKLFRKT